MNIFSKISSNEYNNRLEQILETKPFDEEVKNNRNGEVTATLTLEGSNNFGGITIYYV